MGADPSAERPWAPAFAGAGESGRQFMSTAAFREARDLLLALREDYDAARAQFRWPRLERFNWALDWFDPELAQGPSAGRTALRIIGDDAASLTFAELSRAVGPGGERTAGAGRAARRPRPADARQLRGAVGDHAGGDEAGRGDHPGDDPAHCRRHRRARGAGQRAVLVTDAALARKFGELDLGVTRIAVGGAAAGWTATATCSPPRPASRPTAPTGADDPILLYFTSGTTAKPKLVMHSHRSYGGQPLDPVLARAAARRHAPQRLLAGLGQARLELFLRAVERRGDGVHPQPARGSTRRRCWTRWLRTTSPRSARRRRSGGC